MSVSPSDSYSTQSLKSIAGSNILAFLVNSGISMQAALMESIDIVARYNPPDSCRWLFTLLRTLSPFQWS